MPLADPAPLAAAERALLLCQLAIGPADWQGFAQAAREVQQHGAPRAWLEESLLQAALFHGFPRAITAFETLGRVWPASEAPAGGSLPRAEQAAAGRALFAAIYGERDEGVLLQLAAAHGELHDYVLECAYGRIMARPGLAPRLRELLAVAALAVQQQLPQLVAHGRGALRLGASEPELRATLELALADPGAVRDLLRRITGRQQPPAPAPGAG